MRDGSSVYHFETAYTGYNKAIPPLIRKANLLPVVNQIRSNFLLLRQMSILAKATSSSKRAAIYTIRRNILTTRATMSSISDAIKKDHEEIKEYANNIRSATDDDSQARWQNQFTWELARHSIGEELVVYPAFAKHLGASGQAMADKDRAEHQSVCFNPLQGSLFLRLTATGQGSFIQVSKLEASKRRLHTNSRGSHAGPDSTYQRGGE